MNHIFTILVFACLTTARHFSASDGRIHYALVHLLENYLQAVILGLGAFVGYIPSGIPQVLSKDRVTYIAGHAGLKAK